jgi:serine/threonine-protein phosphatase 6 regulatory ankyrin repeat subunit B
VEYLVAQGAQLEARTDDGFTALLLAAEKGHYAVVRLLGEHGADVNVTEPRGHQFPLYVAAIKGNLATLETLLALDASVNSQNIAGFTALNIASQLGHTDCVIALLQAGADPTIMQSDGAAPIHQAAGNNREGAVAALLDHGCDLNLVSI